jgi:pimeloyl-ACP methyl ester carboxylesterase
MKYWVEGDGPLLVSLPGLDGTGRLFYKQAPRLAARYRVVLIKLPDEGKFTYKDLADHVAAIIRALGHQRALVVGESFGGTVALWFALLHPDMVDRLVIVNSFPRFRRRALLRIGVLLARKAPRGFVWLIRSAGNEIGLMVDGVGREDRRRFFEIARTVKPEGYARRLELIQELDIADKISEIRAPTLLIAGGRDLLVPSVREAGEMAARMPNARVRVVPGAGHACLLGDKVSICDLLDEWMGSIEVPVSGSEIQRGLAG